MVHTIPKNTIQFQCFALDYQPYGFLAFPEKLLFGVCLARLNACLFYTCDPRIVNTRAFQSQIIGFQGLPFQTAFRALPFLINS